MKIGTPFTRLFLAFILGASLAAPAASRGADSTADIPGALWVGPSIADTVGGPFVDRVWRLEIAEGRVAMLRLAGENGAELGLYLFDRYARSVVTDDPIKSSAKAGGTQSIVASLPPGTYYVDVNGRNVDRAYAFTLSVSLFPDLTAPELLPRFTDGNPRASGPSVVVLPNAFDSLSGVESIRHRIGGAEWSDWKPYNAQVAVPLPDAEGSYEIGLEVRNGVGLTSATAVLTVVVDRTAPSATPVSAFINGFATSARPRIAYRFSEAMSRTSVGSALVVTDFRGSRIAGSVVYDATTNVGTFTPSESLELGKSYAVDLVGARDLAGNLALSPGGWSFVYVQPTSVRGSVSTNAVKVGSTVKISGSTKGIPAGTRVSLEWRAAGSLEWRVVGNSVVRGDATAAIVSPISSGAYRMTYAGDFTRAASVSAQMKVTVRPALNLSGAGGYVRVRSAGATVTLRGLADPTTLPLVFARYRCNASFTSCVRVGGETVSAGPDGRATATWVASSGYWGFRLKTAGTVDFSASSTALLKFRVP